MAKNTTTTTSKPATNGNVITIELPKGKDCKGSVRFETADDNAIVSNIYVSRSWAPVSNASKVRVTVEILD